VGTEKILAAIAAHQRRDDSPQIAAYRCAHCVRFRCIGSGKTRLGKTKLRKANNRIIA